MWCGWAIKPTFLATAYTCSGPRQSGGGWMLEGWLPLAQWTNVKEEGATWWIIPVTGVLTANSWQQWQRGGKRCKLSSPYSRNYILAEQHPFIEDIVQECSQIRNSTGFDYPPPIISLDCASPSSRKCGKKQVIKFCTVRNRDCSCVILCVQIVEGIAQPAPPPRSLLILLLSLLMCFREEGRNYTRDAMGAG